MSFKKNKILCFLQNLLKLYGDKHKERTLGLPFTSLIGCQHAFVSSNCWKLQVLFRIQYVSCKSFLYIAVDVFVSYLGVLSTLQLRGKEISDPEL